MAKVGSRKKPRIAQEKGRGGFVSKTTTGKSAAPRKNAGETFMYLLIFGLVSVLFLNFMGIVKIPFLQFMRPGGKDSGDAQGVTQEAISSQTGEQSSLYQGPQLETVNNQAQSSSTEKLQNSEAGQKDEVKSAGDGIEVMVEPENQSGETQGEQSVRLSHGDVSEETAVATPENVYRMAKIYSAMEPQEAVRILEKFSDEEVVMIFSSMKERQVAEILKAFPVERAAEIARKMMKGR